MTILRLASIMPAEGSDTEGTASHRNTLVHVRAPADPGGTTGPRRWVRPVLWCAAAVAMFFVYHRVSQTYPSDSYGGVFTLQGWDMLHGNLLLHGWSVSDVSFYTTELPEYALVDWVRGFNPDVVHIAAAITFTLLLLLVALLAKGRANGIQAVAGVLIAAGIMGAPQLGAGVFLLLLAPDHLGSCVPVLLAWLILDRCLARWYVPVAVGALLAWVLIADPVVLLTGVFPLVAVCGIRMYQAIVRQRLPWRAWWYEASLIAAALVADGIARAALALIRAHGGLFVNPVQLTFTSITALPHHLRLAVQGILVLFGADFSWHKSGFMFALALLHLAGLALAVWAVGIAVRRFNRGIGLVPQILVVAVFINLAGFLLWGSLSTDITATREIVGVLPFVAVLAGRLPAGRLTATLVLPALSAVLIGYLASLAFVTAHPVKPYQYQQPTSWLTAHGFRHGLGWAPMSGEITVSSRGRVELRPVWERDSVLAITRWESQASWFDPRLHNATFLVQYGQPPNPSASAVLSMFGRPQHTYRFGLYTVMTWDKNLLYRLHRGAQDTA